MPPVAGTCIQRGQKECPRGQLEGECLENHGASRPDCGIGHIRQP